MYDFKLSLKYIIHIHLVLCVMNILYRALAKNLRVPFPDLCKSMLGISFCIEHSECPL